MDERLTRRRLLQLGMGGSALALLAACDTTGFNFGPESSGRGRSAPQAPAQLFGTGPTRVALLLPLSGDPGIANVGISMANAAQMAIAYVTATPRVGNNITVQLLDTGTTANGAAQQASAALADGAQLILGPLKADQVQAAGAVAKAANVPLIGFSNNSSAAAPGVYLLNVLPETEVRRSLGYAASRGHRNVAALFPNSDFGQVQQAAFNASVARAGLGVKSSSVYNGVGDAQGLISQLAPQFGSGGIDTLFLPDRATAPAIGAMVQAAGVAGGKLLIVGSADWDDDPTILAAPGLVGAIFPALDDAGYRALRAEYLARFGSEPHPLATIAYTAVVLANAAPLAAAHYSAPLLTMPGGFNGRDGVFRFLADGRSQYALAIKQIGNGTAQRIDGPKL